MLAGLLIGLREGLEASLIVGILIAYLVKIDLKSRIRSIWIGVISATIFSLIVGVAVGLTSESLSEFAEKFFAGTMSFVAVGFVTGMIFWMRTASKGLAKDLRNQIDNALISGGTIGLTVLSFAAVALRRLLNNYGRSLWIPTMSMQHAWESLCLLRLLASNLLALCLNLLTLPLVFILDIATITFAVFVAIRKILSRSF